MSGAYRRLFGNRHVGDVAENILKARNIYNDTREADLSNSALTEEAISMVAVIVTEVPQIYELLGISVPDKTVEGVKQITTTISQAFINAVTALEEETGESYQELIPEAIRNKPQEQ